MTGEWVVRKNIRSKKPWAHAIGREARNGKAYTSFLCNPSSLYKIENLAEVTPEEFDLCNRCQYEVTKQVTDKLEGKKTSKPDVLDNWHKDDHREFSEWE